MWFSCQMHIQNATLCFISFAGRGSFPSHTLSLLQPLDTWHSPPGKIQPCYTLLLPTCSSCIILKIESGLGGGKSTIQHCGYIYSIREALCNKGVERWLDVGLMLQFNSPIIISYISWEQACAHGHLCFQYSGAETKKGNGCMQKTSMIPWYPSQNC